MPIAATEIKNDIERKLKQKQCRILAMTDIVNENYCVICEPVSKSRPNLVAFFYELSSHFGPRVYKRECDPMSGKVYYP